MSHVDKHQLWRMSPTDAHCTVITFGAFEPPRSKRAFFSRVVFRQLTLFHFEPHFPAFVAAGVSGERASVLLFAPCNCSRAQHHVVAAAVVALGGGDAGVGVAIAAAALIDGAPVVVVVVPHRLFPRLLHLRLSSDDLVP